MKMFKCIVASFSIITIVMFSECNNQPCQQENTKQEEYNQTVDKRSINKSSNRNEFELADTITYGVIIKPTPTTNKDFIKNLDKNKFIDIIFKAVYDKKLDAYDYYTGEKLSVKDIDKILSHEEYSRQAIGRVLFTEKWVMDTVKLTMKKNIHSMIFGYELYRSDGEFKGYHPLFKIALN